MPVIDPVTSQNGLAIAASAILFALLDTLALDKAQIKTLLDTARIGIGARSTTIEGAEALKVLQSLGDHFAKR